MANDWKVKFIDNDSSDYQTASFSSKKDAEIWIKNCIIQSKYDPNGFEVVEGPYAEEQKINIWFDSIRPAPNGFKWIKTVEDFIDGIFVDIDKDFNKIGIISFDTKNDMNGHSFKDVLNRAENDNVSSLKVSVHGNDVEKKTEILNQAKQNGWEIIEDLFENNDAINQINEMFNKVGIKADLVSESWKPEFNDMPQNQWGSKWKKIDPENFIYQTIKDVIDDCQLDPTEKGPKVDGLTIDSIHLVENGNIICALFGGANGGGEGCTFKSYLALIKKLINKLLDISAFEDAWLIDWENDLRDDVYGIRFVLKPTEEYIQKFQEKNILNFLEESISKKFDPQKYVREFKDYFGYQDEYMPTATHEEKMDSIARECALRMPTDIEACETEGDAVMMLVLSGDDEAVKVGKKLGDCMMKKGKHDEETLLKCMSDAYKALQELWSKYERKKEIELNESASNYLKLWIDDIRPAPKGYIWIKSVNDFIDWLVEHSVQNIQVIDIDHDAGDYQKDGGDYIKCLDYLESIGADNINVRIHSANPVGVDKIKAIIKKNQWNEVFDVIDEDEVEESQLDGGDYRALMQAEDEKMINEVDVVASKSNNPTYEDLIDALSKIDRLTPIRILAAGHEAYTTNYYGRHTIDHWKIDVNGYIVFNDLTKSGHWKCIIRDVPKEKACPAFRLVEWLENNMKDLNSQITIWPGFSSKGQFELVDNRDNPTHMHKVTSFELSEEGTLDLNLVDVELYESIKECYEQLNEDELDEAEDSAKKDKLIATLKKASKDFQNAASNYDPEQFSKIVVAFDDLMSGVGAYDFKKKKVLKEVEEDRDVDLEDQLKFDEIAEAMQDAGISDVSVEFEPGKKTSINIDIPSKIVMHGSFDDKYPLDTLNFHWHDKDENVDAGWYEGTRCMNKWRGIGKQILDRILPTGFPNQLVNGE